MKAFLKFNLEPGHPDRDEYELVMNATKYSLLLEFVEQKLFRPARKHGYSDPEMIDWVQGSAAYNDSVTHAIGRLETLYYEKRQELGIDG